MGGETAESENESLAITRQEYAALNEIRGLAQDTFYMMVAAKQTSNGYYVLEGSSEAFDHLTSDLFDEIYEELSPKSRLKHLAKLYRRLSPDGEF